MSVTPDAIDVESSALACEAPPTVRQLLRKLRGLRTVLGVTRVADLTELDRVGIPVVSATRATANKGQITVCQGKGLRLPEALVSALMEATERHSASAFRRTRMATSQQLAAQAAPHVPPTDLGAPSPCERPIEWVESIRLRDGRPTLIPAAEVMFPYTPADGVSRPMRPTTSGLAAGASLTQAITHAIFEVVERDAVSLHAEGAQCPLLDLDSVGPGPCSRVIDLFARSGVQLTVIDLAPCAVFPAYKAYAVDSGGYSHLAVAGQGADLNPHVALLRALLEVAQARVVAIQGSREDLDRHVGDWAARSEEVWKRYGLIRAWAQSHGTIAIPKHEPELAPSANRLQAVSRQLAASGYPDVYVTDLTDPAVGLPVVHVCVPGMVDSVADPSRRRYVSQPR